MRIDNEFFPRLQNYLKTLNSSEISDSRKEILQQIATYINRQKEKHKTAKLIFICTHNSRRSQMAQVWAKVFSEFHGIPVELYSGGTEITAFHPNAIKALERAGFKIENTDGKNPDIFIHFSGNDQPIRCFSKLFNDSTIPDKDFAAVMTCSDADENCPIIPGASERILLSYKDPKEFDNTDQEATAYDKCCMQIASEMKYLFSPKN